MAQRVGRHLIAALLAPVVLLAVIGCGDSGPPAPDGPLAEALAEIGGGGEHGSTGVGWTEPRLARGAGVSPELMADALGPNAQSVVETAPELRRRFGLDPLSAQRLVSVGGSYAFGLRLDGIDGSRLRAALLRAGGRPKPGDGVDLVDVAGYAQVPQPLLRAGVFGLGARDAFRPDFTVLSISANARATLLGRNGGLLIEQPIYRAAADCLGDVVAARMIPERLVLSVEVGIELVAVGIARDREVLCVLGGTGEQGRDTAAGLRASLTPGARDPRTGEPISQLIEPGAKVEASSYEDVDVVRAEVVPVAGREGFFFGAIHRGSLLQMLSAQ